MSAALQSSDLFPKVPRVSLSEVPEVSAYFKNTLRAMFGEDEDKVRSYVQEITQMSWTPEKMRERLAGIEDGEQLKSAMRRLRRDVMMSLVARDISGLANLRSCHKHVRFSGDHDRPHSFRVCQRAGEAIRSSALRNRRPPGSDCDRHGQVGRS